jgi:hypothetical protein
LFQLTKEEYDGLRFQIETLENSHFLRSQFVTSNSRGGIRYLPHDFTEQGVDMLSGVLNSDKGELVAHQRKIDENKNPLCISGLKCVVVPCNVCNG